MGCVRIYANTRRYRVDLHEHMMAWRRNICPPTGERRCKSAIGYIENKMYLPNQTAPNAEINLNIVSSAKGMTILKDENGRVKRIAIILIANAGGLSVLEILRGLTIASNRLRGVGSGRTGRRPTRCPSNGSGNRPAATNYIASLEIPRTLVKTENRQSQVRAQINLQIPYDAAHGMAAYQEQKAMRRSRKSDHGNAQISKWNMPTI